MNYLVPANVRTLDTCPPDPHWRGQILSRARGRRDNLSVANHLLGGPKPIQIQDKSQVSSAQCPGSLLLTFPFPQFPHFAPLPSASPTSSLLQRRRWIDYDRGPVSHLAGEGKWDAGSGNLLLPIWAAWLNGFQVLLIKINCPGRFCQRKHPKLQAQGCLKMDVLRAALESLLF